MVEIIRAGGWLMLPIILCSIVAIAIVIERFWSLSATRITPKHTLAQVWTWLKNSQLDSSKLRELRLSSDLVSRRYGIYGGVVRTVFGEGRTLSYKDQELTLNRGTGPAQVWMNLDYSPILDEDGSPLGVVAIVVETTEMATTPSGLPSSSRMGE